MWLNNRAGYLQDWITQLWVKTTGKRFDPVEDNWLLGPTGSTEIIKDKFFIDLAENENLTISENDSDTGLLNSMSDLLDNETERERIHPKIIDFYEHTSRYDFEVWSEWNGIFKPFGKMLSIIFSRRLQQLNLPLNPIDSAKGIVSNILKLKDKNNSVKYTVWYRILKSSNDVIFSGVYAPAYIKGKPDKHLKVIFPLPNGNASVVMKKEVLNDGSLLLSSEGTKFGDNGFYFTLTDGNGKHWAKFVKFMHVWIHVYVDEENVLRTDHTLYFYGRPLLKLHYKMIYKYAPN